MIQKLKLAYLTYKAAKINAGRLTAANFMRGLGLDETDVRRFRGAFGSKVRDAYAAVNDGALPPKDGVELMRIKGKFTLVPAYAYDWDQQAILVRALLNHPSVAKLAGV
jgi:hypothetical protein